MECAAHAVVALIRIGDKRLRGLEGLPRLKMPCETAFVDAELQACDVIGVHFGMQVEVAGVFECQANDLAMVFAGSWPGECRDGIGEMPAGVAQ